jgi:5-methyltetrahydrofolate--homocysteine methyltransferase
MISPAMYKKFCWQDLVESCDHVDRSLYHLDGPGAIPHLPQICSVEKLNSIQWIPGAGAPPPSQWMGLLRRMQEYGKSVQVWPLLNCTMDELVDEVGALCQGLDPTRLFIVAEVDSVERAYAVIAKAKETSASSGKTAIRMPEGA